MIANDSNDYFKQHEQNKSYLCLLLRNETVLQIVIVSNWFKQKRLNANRERETRPKCQSVYVVLQTQ